MNSIKRNIIFILLGFILATPMTFAPTASATNNHNYEECYGKFSCYCLVFREDKITAYDYDWNTAFEREIELKKKGKVIVRVSSEVKSYYGCQWKVKIKINKDWKELFGPRYFAPTGSDYWGTFTGNYWICDVPYGKHEIKVVFKSNDSTSYIKQRTLEITSDQTYWCDDYCPEDPPDDPTQPDPCTYECEAEYGNLYCQEKYDDKASGGYCVSAPESWGRDLDDHEIGDKISEYDFYVDCSDTYYLWALVKEPSSRKNSFWLQMDVRDHIEWRMDKDNHGGDWDSKHNEWHWDRKKLGYLMPGYHTFTLWNREAGTMMDKYEITTDKHLHD